MIQFRLLRHALLKNYQSQYRSVLVNQLLKYFSIYAIISVIFVTNTFAQVGSIKNLDIFIADNELNLICHFKRNFIDDNMRQTLSSGMSSTFNFQINLKYENGSLIRNQTVEVAIRYDIWEKQYLLFHNDQIHQFSTYETFESFLYDSLTFDLGSVTGIDYKKSLRLIVFFSPEKISSAQKEKLNYWLTDDANTKESAPGMEQESGFSIDLSRLFSIFLSDEPESNIQQFRSGLFSIEKLRKNEKPAQ